MPRDKFVDLGLAIANQLRSVLSPDDLKAISGGDARAEWREKYWSQPAAWARDNIRWPAGQSLAPYQTQILDDLATYHRVATWGPRGFGKSTLCSLAILWMVTTRDGYVDWKIPTTAGGYRQLEKYLWPEIHKWARMLRWDKIGRRPFSPRNELMQLSLRGQTGEAFGAACDNPDLMEGGHASQILFVFDESKAIPDGVFDAVEGMLTQAGIGGREAFLLASSSPGPPAGRFWQICMRKDGYSDWHPRQVSLPEAIAAGMISEQWAKRRARQWGVSSTLFQCHVLGKFTDTGKDGVIPASWVEDAQGRPANLAEGPEEGAKRVVLGVDVAKGGNNESVIAVRKGWAITELIALQSSDLMEVVNVVMRQARKHKPEAIMIDSVGVGAGPYAFLVEKGLPVVSFHGGEAAPERDFSGEIEFVNRRSWAWWRLRELLHPYGEYKISLPDDSVLLTQLVTPAYYKSGDRLMVEKKEEIEKKLRRVNPNSTDSLSTDRADACVMAFAESSSHFEDAYALVHGQGTAPRAPEDVERTRQVALAERERERAERQAEREARARPESEQLEAMLWRGAHTNHDIWNP